jgi:hypothetical protein
MTTIPNWLALLGLVVPAATGLAGYVLAGRNEQARDERAASREEIARRATVRERLVEQRHALQRDTLLELQDVLQKQVRISSQVIFYDRKSLEEHSTLTLLGDDLNQQSYDIGVAVRRLQERVLDAALRDAVERFRDRVAAVGVGVTGHLGAPNLPTVADLDQRLSHLNNEYTAVSALVGAALRAELEWIPAHGYDAAPALIHP